MERTAPLWGARVRGMEERAVHTDPSMAEALRAFAGAVRDSPHNLVSRRARDELLTRHVPECVALAAALPRGPARVLDLGSGGGFPGMVVAITRPDLEVHLLDATAKKTAFLSEVAASLQVGVEVHTGRAEELARSALASSFDVVTARAVAGLEQLVTWSLPFLRPNGLLYAMKGERWAEEVDAATDVVRRTGASIVATPADVPVDGREGLAPRVVIVARGSR